MPLNTCFIYTIVLIPTVYFLPLKFGWFKVKTSVCKEIKKKTFLIHSKLIFNNLPFKTDYVS